MSNDHPSADHVARVKKDLAKAGVTKYGALKLESRYLPKLIHNDEQIGGVVYGRYERGSAMLVATDRRILFLDRMPFYTVFKEITYDVVSGVSQSFERPFFASVILHTRLGDFQLRFVNLKACEHFVEYIESRRLENVSVAITDLQPPAMKPDSLGVDIPDEALQFLKEHDIAVLSTVDDSGHPYGSVVFYSVGDNKLLYLVTKAETAKARNILKNPDVGFTIFDAPNQQTAQIQGKAKIETGPNTRQEAFDQIVRSRMSAPGGKMPPITKIEAGEYVVISINVTTIKYRDFGNSKTKD